MKSVFNAVLFSFFLVPGFLISCKKPVPDVIALTATQTASPVGFGFDSIRNYLRNHLPVPIYRTIDSTGFDTMKLNRLLYVRVPFTGTPLERRFILLTLEETGEVSGAGIIQIDLDLNTMGGKFQSAYLDGTLATAGTINNGTISLVKSQVSVNATGTQPMVSWEPVYTPLPEVIVYPASGGTGAAYYYLPAIRLLAPHQIHNPASGAGSVVGSGTGSGYAVYTRAASNGGLPAIRANAGRPATITVETSYSKPAINLDGYLKCFDQVPSAGAQYSVQVMVDLPVNDDPSISFNYLTGAVGHVFMAYTKTNGTNSVTQYIGFAATKPFKAMFLTTPVAGKLVDNEAHKYNARYTIPVSASGFESALNATAQQVGSYYDLANFNCVDFTLGIVNSITPNALTVQPLPLPGSPVQMSTPGSLYSKLSQMKAAGNKNVENNGIWVAGDSHGACN